MIIELSNGLDHLFQWDSGQKIKISDGVPTVHFKWGNVAVPFDVVDGWVEIPPELTQKDGEILLWTYKKDHTLDAAKIPVERRLKPVGYAYTPTEIKTWESLDKRIKALEDGGGVAGVSSVNGQTGAVTITAAGLGALTEDDLQSATNTALAQAKASGEFDGAPGAPGTPGNDGLSINWRGEYVESTAYAKNDAVSYGGSAYIMVSNSVIGAVPGIDDDWQLMVQKGDAGAQGPAGAGLDVTGATVGQTVKISAVDDNGVPTAWVPVDMTAGGETWEKIADVALTADVSVYQLADFGAYRKIKALISRDTYVSGLNKNVWFRIRSKTVGNDVIAATYVTAEYGYIALEISAEMGDMFTRVGTATTNNRQSATYDKRTIDVISPTNPSGYGLYMMFMDTSVIQTGDTVTVYGVKR